MLLHNLMYFTEAYSHCMITIYWTFRFILVIVVEFQRIYCIFKNFNRFLVDWIIRSLILPELVCDSQQGLDLSVEVLILQSLLGKI